MADVTNVTVEVTPNDCSWQTARELIENIKQRNPNGYKLGFVVKDCFKVDKDKKTAENVYQFNNNNAIVSKNVYMS